MLCSVYSQSSSFNLLLAFLPSLFLIPYIERSLCLICSGINGLSSSIFLFIIDTHSFVFAISLVLDKFLTSLSITSSYSGVICLFRGVFLLLIIFMQLLVISFSVTITKLPFFPFFLLWATLKGDTLFIWLPSSDSSWIIKESSSVIFALLFHLFVASGAMVNRLLELMSLISSDSLHDFLILVSKVNLLSGFVSIFSSSSSSSSIICLDARFLKALDDVHYKYYLII